MFHVHDNKVEQEHAHDNLITHKVTSYRPAELGANGRSENASFPATSRFSGKISPTGVLDTGALLVHGPDK